MKKFLKLSIKEQLEIERLLLSLFYAAKNGESKSVEIVCDRLDAIGVCWSAQNQIFELARLEREKIKSASIFEIKKVINNCWLRDLPLAG